MACDLFFCGDFEEKEEQEELFTFALPGADAVVSLLCAKHPPNPPLWPVRAQDLRPPATHPRPTCARRSAPLVKQEKPLPQNVTTALLTNNSSVSAPQSTSIYFFPLNHVQESTVRIFLCRKTYVFCYCSGLKKKERE